MINDSVHTAAQANYSNSASPWPEYDLWHEKTFQAENKTVERWLSVLARDESVILNAGSGGTNYQSRGTFIHLDIIEKYICQYERYLVGSIEKIDSPAQTYDGIICVGSVLNYADAQRSIREFARVLKQGGFLILEFERTESAEFLFTTQHGKDVFLKSYSYGDQLHLLWMYSEKHIRRLLDFYGFRIKRIKRVHGLSSLLYRFGLSEERAAPYSKFDRLLQPISFPISHNVLFLCAKEVIT